MLFKELFINDNKLLGSYLNRDTPKFMQRYSVTQQIPIPLLWCSSVTGRFLIHSMKPTARTIQVGFLTCALIRSKVNLRSSIRSMIS